MKALMIIILSLLLPALSMAQSASSPDTRDTSVEKKKTLKEQIVEKSHNVKRAVKKGAHQMREMACNKNDQKCLALKEKHRAMEQAEYHRDKLSESQDSIQSMDNP